MVLTLCAAGAQGQTALEDTLHITPAMIDSLRAAEVVEPFERDIETVVFVPKGQWITGVSVSYT